jgi:hypothetical protein
MPERDKDQDYDYRYRDHDSVYDYDYSRRSIKWIAFTLACLGIIAGVVAYLSK